MTQELLPCPFCGSEAIVKRNKTVMVNCTQCTAATFQRLSDALSAVTAWNTRASTADLQVRLDAAEGRIAELVEALTPFSRLCVADDLLEGITPSDLREAVAKARTLVCSIRAQEAARSAPWPASDLTGDTK